MSKNKKIMSNSEQEKVAGGCGEHGCPPSCPHCGKELPPPPSPHHRKPHGHRHRGPHEPKPKEGEPNLAPPEVSTPDPIPTSE